MRERRRLRQCVSVHAAARSAKKEEDDDGLEAAARRQEEASKRYLAYRRRYAATSPYEVLGLKHGAVIEDVKRAFRSLAKELHPDVAASGAASGSDGANDDGKARGGGGTMSAEEVEERFVRLQSAYELLSNEESKRCYDDEHRQHPYAASKSWRTYLEKRKRAFAQSGPGAMTAYRAQVKRAEQEAAKRWDQAGDAEVARRRGARMRAMQKQKAESLTRLHYLTCRKRDIMQGEEDGGMSTEAGRLEVLRLADEMLREEEGVGIKDAGMYKAAARRTAISGGGMSSSKAMLPSSDRTHDEGSDDDDDAASSS